MKRKIPVLAAAAFLVSCGSGLLPNDGFLAVSTPTPSSTPLPNTDNNGNDGSGNNNNGGGNTSGFTSTQAGPWAEEAYLKAPNTRSSLLYGSGVAISGTTAVFAAYGDASNQTTITNGTTASTNTAAANSGAIFVMKRTGTSWAQEAYIKPPNTHAGDQFGHAVAIDGDTIVVGVPLENSNQNTITNGTTASTDTSSANSGAVYVFRRTGTSWAQEAYIKASNAHLNDNFGDSVAISGDTIVVGAIFENSNATGISNGATASTDTSLSNSGAVYVYKRTGTSWAQEAYIKPPYPATNLSFGHAVAISGDTIAVGYRQDAAAQNTITNGATASNDTSASSSGAVFVYARSGTTWSQQAYIKAPNNLALSLFGDSVAIESDTIVVGSTSERSNQTTITNGTTASADVSLSGAGAVYVFKRTGTSWAQEAYIKASNTRANLAFGSHVAISNNAIVVATPGEKSNQTTITNGATASSDISLSNAGAAYVFLRTGTSWAQTAYLKAPNNVAGTVYGSGVGIYDGVIVVGALGEKSNQTTITNSSTASTDTSLSNAGAGYVVVSP